MKRAFLVFCIAMSLASLAFHATADYLGDPRLQFTGLALVLVSLVCAVSFHPLFGKGEPGEESRGSRLDLAACLVALAAAFVLYLVAIRPPGPWSEEVWWVEQAKEILSGTRIHPAGFKGDHPANFQAWPVAFFLLLTGDPLLAVRLPGVLYALSTAGLCAATVRAFRPRALLFPTFVLSAFSLSLLYYASSGWNEMSIVPFLVSGQLCFFSRVALRRDARALVPLALFSGFGAWTLYTPFVFSLIVVGGLFLLPGAVLPRRRKLLFALCFALVVAPTAGKMIRYPNLALSRHEKFLEGGEWDRTFNEKYRPLPTYSANLGRVFVHMMPRRDPYEQWNLTGINLEPTTAVLAGVGLLAGVFLLSWLERGVLFGSFLLLLTGLILSNPQESLWRELCLLPFPLVIAGLGWHLVVSAMGRLWKSTWLAPAGAVLLAVLHGGIWAQRFEWFHTKQPGYALGDGVKALYREVRGLSIDVARVAVPDAAGGLMWRYFNSFLYRNPAEPVKFTALVELHSRLRERQVGAIVVVPDEQSPTPKMVEDFLAERGVVFSRRAVKDRQGRAAGWIYVVS